LFKTLTAELQQRIHTFLMVVGSFTCRCFNYINVHKCYDLNTRSQILKEYLLTMLLDTVSISLENGNGSAVDEQKTIKRS